eukprot:COSAG02_NODE_14344_length_1282_cov_1.359256_2_plen_99_part_01
MRYVYHHLERCCQLFNLRVCSVRRSSCRDMAAWNHGSCPVLTLRYLRRPFRSIIARVASEASKCCVSHEASVAGLPLVLPIRSVSEVEEVVCVCEGNRG